MNVSHEFMSLGAVSQAVREAMAGVGIVTDDSMVVDGQLHRVHVEGDRPGTRNAWYVIYGGRFAAGAYGCWKRDVQERWCEVELKSLSKRDREEVIAYQMAARQQAEQERRRQHDAAAERAMQLWNAAGPADPNHPYLVEKRVKAYGIRQKDRALLIPLWGRERRLWSLQFINPGGRKLFLPGGAIRGHFHVVGQLKTRLGANPIAIQVPIGAEDAFEGVVDLVSMKAIYWDDAGQGTTYEARNIPGNMEAMCQEIMRALQFFYSSSPFNSVDQLLLAGGCAQIAGIDELVAARIGVPALVANPFTSMSLASRIKPQVLANDAPSLMIACGLAVRSFDD